MDFCSTRRNLLSIFMSGTYFYMWTVNQGVFKMFLNLYLNRTYVCDNINLQTKERLFEKNATTLLDEVVAVVATDMDEWIFICNRVLEV